MYLIATDILAELCGLSLGLIIAVIPIGMMLTLFGWWSHRFWIVLTTTVTAGVFGMLEASHYSARAQPIVVGVLLAIAAGVLALALVRVITFAAGGVVSVYLAHFAFPALNQQIICFLVGGLVCLLLFRWCFMALTSFAGSVISAYGILALLHYHETLDAVSWADEHTMRLNILCGVSAVCGFGCQFLLDRRRRRRRREEHEDEEEGDFVGAVLGRIGFGGQSRRDAA